MRNRILAVVTLTYIVSVSSVAQSYSLTPLSAGVVKVKSGLKATSQSQNNGIMINVKKYIKDGAIMGPPQCYSVFLSNSDSRWGAFVYGLSQAKECAQYLANGVDWIHLSGKRWVTFQGGASYMENAQCLQFLKSAKAPKLVIRDYLAFSFGPCAPANG